MFLYLTPSIVKYKPDTGLLHVTYFFDCSSMSFLALEAMYLWFLDK